MEEEVYKLFKFDLCIECQREIIKDPLLKQPRIETHNA